jgi:hypothetical protein
MTLAHPFPAFFAVKDTRTVVAVGVPDKDTAGFEVNAFATGTVTLDSM